MNAKRIAFLGAGNMGEAMIRGLLKAGLATPADITAADLRAEQLAALSSELDIHVTPDAAGAAINSELVVLAVKPQSIPALLASFQGHLPSTTLVVTIAAGIRVEKIREWLPRQPVIRVMPNTPALLGQGASAYCLGPGVTETQARDAEEMLSCLGVVARVDETQMDAVTALSGSGPAYVFLFMEALQSAGEKLGLDSATSFKLAAQTLTGASAMIAKQTHTPTQLRERVTSPGGTTAAALQVFEESGFRELVLKALTAARDRGRELGK